MQTKASNLPRPVGHLSHAFAGAATILLLGTATLVADPPGPAQIELEPVMTAPSVSLGVEVTLIAANHGGTGPFTYLWRRDGQQISGADVAGPRLNLGAKVRVDAKIGGQERWQLRQIVRPGCGGTLVAHFGLGDAAKVNVLRVEWPSGVVQEYREVGVNQSLVIREPPRLVPTGPCEFEVRCWLGMQFAVQTSVDLKTWSSVGSVTNVNGTATFSDTEGVHGTCRFYRVVEE